MLHHTYDLVLADLQERLATAERERTATLLVRARRADRRARRAAARADRARWHAVGETVRV